MTFKSHIIALFLAFPCVLGCQPKQETSHEPFAEAKAMVCPDKTQRIEVRESSYPEFYCVGFKGRTGPWLEFDAEGRIRKRANYLNDKMNGEWLAYHPNGAIETRGQMKDDMRVGLWTQYYINGKMRSEKNYANNQQDGPLKLYYQDGKLMADGAYVAGVEEGPWHVYTPEGKLARECRLVHGEEKDCVVHDKDFQITTFSYESKERGPL